MGNNVESLTVGDLYRIKRKRGKWKCVRTVKGGGWFVRAKNKEWGNMHAYPYEKIKKA